MEYRYKPFASLVGTKVLLVSPSYENSSFYGRQLGGANLDVMVCNSFTQAPLQLQLLFPHVVIINPETEFEETYHLVAHMAEYFPAVPIITLSHAIPEYHLNAIMSTGASVTHINRSMSKPRDVLVAIEHMLGKK